MAPSTVTQGTDAPVVSAVVPVFRSEATLAALHARLAAVLPTDHEVVFVDDASPDGSTAVLAQLAAADPRVRIVRHAVNRGQHAAVLTGLAEARGDAVVVLDADGQDPPEAIPALLARLRGTARASNENGTEPAACNVVASREGLEARAALPGPQRPAAVFGLRHGAYGRRGRRITGQAFRALLRLASARRLPAGAGMFFALSADLAAQLAAARSADGPGPYVVGLIARSGATLDGVPVERSAAAATSYTRSARLAVGARALREAVRR